MLVAVFRHPTGRRAGERLGSSPGSPLAFPLRKRSRCSMDVAPLDLQRRSRRSRRHRSRPRWRRPVREWRFAVEGPWAFATPAGARSRSRAGSCTSPPPRRRPPTCWPPPSPSSSPGVPFKFAADQPSSGSSTRTHADRASGGKFLTVYPADDDQAVRLAEACHQATEGLAGPVILSDRPYRPGSLVHYRYGGFSGPPAIDADGVVVHLIRAPDGEPLPDERTASYRAPSWLTDPFQPAAEPAGRRQGEPACRRPAAPSSSTTATASRAPCSHANKGGTYLAEDATTGGHGRHQGGPPPRRRRRPGRRPGPGPPRGPHAGPRRVPRPRAPPRRPVRAERPRLPGQGAHRRPVACGRSSRATPSSPAAPLPADELLALAAALAQAMAAVHAAGVVLGDFNPNNILVADDGARSS